MKSHRKGLLISISLHVLLLLCAILANRILTRFFSSPSSSSYIEFELLSLAQEVGTDPALEMGTDPAPEMGTDPAPEMGSDPALEMGTDPAPEMGTDPAPDVGTDPAPEVGTDPAPEMGTDPAPEMGTDPAPEMGTDPDGPICVDGIKAQYPRGARRRGEEGDVTVGFKVNADGVVTEAEVVKSSGYGALDAAAVKSVRSAKFQTPNVFGSRLDSAGEQVISFRLK